MHALNKNADLIKKKNMTWIFLFPQPQGFGNEPQWLCAKC